MVQTRQPQQVKSGVGGTQHQNGKITKKISVTTAAAMQQAVVALVFGTEATMTVLAPLAVVSNRVVRR